jgi:hypothetical protein
MNVWKQLRSSPKIGCIRNNCLIWALKQGSSCNNGGVFFGKLQSLEVDIHAQINMIGSKLLTLYPDTGNLAISHFSGDASATTCEQHDSGTCDRRPRVHSRCMLGSILCLKPSLSHSRDLCFSSISNTDSSRETKTQSSGSNSADISIETSARILVRFDFPYIMDILRAPACDVEGHGRWFSNKLHQRSKLLTKLLKVEYSNLIP